MMSLARLPRGAMTYRPGSNTRQSEPDDRNARRQLQRVQAVLLLAAAACSGGDSPEGTAKVDTLENGAVLVSNAAMGVWGGRPAWRLTDEVKIGARDGEAPEVFGHIAHIELDEFGRVYVLDFHAQEIRVFEADGSYVRALGGRGAGPGEFRYARGMKFDPAGRLWVVNQNNLRYSLFDTSGVLVEELPRRTGTYFVDSWNAAFTPAGDLYDWDMRYDPSHGELVSTHSPGLPAGTPLGWGYHMLTPHGWWVGVASEYRLWHIDFAGDTVRIVERDHEPKPLAEAQRDSADQELRRLRQRARNRIDMDVPQYERVFNRMVVDDRGYLWVLLSSEDDAQGTTFDVFDPEGRYVGGVPAPYRVEPQPPWGPYTGPPPVIRGNQIAFVTKDALDVDYVVLMRVQGRR
jgi:sugar lactone lactonase YvrE